MAKNSKYQTNIEQVDSGWRAQIIRQVTSKRTTITKQQDDFATESEAKEWGGSELKKLLAAQISSNQRHDKNRKENFEIAQQRSSRRAEKTAIAKAAKAKKKEDQKLANEVIESVDPETNYDFGKQE